MSVKLAVANFKIEETVSDEDRSCYNERVTGRSGKLSRYMTRVAIDRCLHAVQVAMDDLPYAYTEKDKEVQKTCTDLLLRYREQFRADRDGLPED